jgi:hypothetical protein
MHRIRRSIVNDFELPPPLAPADGAPPAGDDGAEAVSAETHPAETVHSEPLPPVDPVRSAAGRLGGQRVHRLAELGREYEKEHGLKAGRQRLKQLVQLGRKYEAEHGLRTSPPHRHKRGAAWQEFLLALARVIRPAHRPAVEQLAAALRHGPGRLASGTGPAA